MMPGMAAFPRNPFEPGAGLMPPAMGWRPKIERVLTDLLERLRDAAPGPRFAFLYGPRGNGKTVLLHWLAAGAAKAPRGREKILRVQFSRTDLASAAIVARKVLNAADGGTFDKVSLSGTGEIGVPGFGSLQVTARGRERHLTLTELLAEAPRPLLLTLDEAHEVDSVRLGEFLVAIQDAGENRPIAAVLAGTPGLERTLRQTRASFWSRGEKLPVGLLSDDAAREALRRPFLDAGLDASDEAVAALAEAADNYPYFLQLYGRDAWRTVEASGARALLPEHIAPTLAEAETGRKAYYNDRYEEFYDARRLPVARRVALAFRNRSAPLTDAEVDTVLAADGQEDSVELKAFLNARGLIWRGDPAERLWIPGIPSLMDHLVESIPAP